MKKTLFWEVLLQSKNNYNKSTNEIPLLLIKPQIKSLQFNWKRTCGSLFFWKNWKLRMASLGFMDPP